MNGQRLDKTVSGLQHRQQELEEWLAETQSEQENLKAEVQQQKDLLQVRVSNTGSQSALAAVDNSLEAGKLDHSQTRIGPSFKSTT